MATFDIHFDDKTVHSLEAEKACHDDIRGLFIFLDADAKPIAWAPALSVHVVAERRPRDEVA
jgi:hypothetical protein